MKHWLRVPRRLRRPRGRRTLVAAVLTAFAVAPAALPYHTQYPEINAVASWLAQREVAVQCLTWPESVEDDVIAGRHGAEAYVNGHFDMNGLWRPSHFAVFKSGHCRNLLAVVDGDLSGRKAGDVAFSILVLTHESGHLRGHAWSADEAKTEAWALRHFVPTAVRLGLSEYQARVLLWYAVEWHRSLPSNYLHPGCREPQVVDLVLVGCRAPFG